MTASISAMPDLRQVLDMIDNADCLLTRQDALDVGDGYGCGLRGRRRIAGEYVDRDREHLELTGGQRRSAG